MTQEQKKIITLYGLFIISVIFNFTPSQQINMIGSIIFIICFIALYIFRKRSKKSSLTYSHSSYIIKSIWVSSLFLFIGMIVAGIVGDHSIVQNTVDTLTNGEVLTEAEINSIMLEYTKANLLTFAVSLIPGIIYLLYRLGKGTKLCLQNTSITNHGNWF